MYNMVSFIRVQDKLWSTDGSYIINILYILISQSHIVIVLYYTVYVYYGLSD